MLKMVVATSLNADNEEKSSIAATKVIIFHKDCNKGRRVCSLFKSICFLFRLAQQADQRILLFHVGFAVLFVHAIVFLVVVAIVSS